MNDRGRNTFRKTERLCSRKLITGLFDEGYVFQLDALRVVWLAATVSLPSPAQVALIVPKKNIRSAVKRNFVRRRMREAYRKNKAILYDFLNETKLNLVFALIYQNPELPDYMQVEENVIKVLKALTCKVKQKYPNLVKD